MSDDHPVLYVTDQFGQSRPWDGECLLCERDALRSRLADIESQNRVMWDVASDREARLAEARANAFQDALDCMRDRQARDHLAACLQDKYGVWWKTDSAPAAGRIAVEDFNDLRKWIQERMQGGCRVFSKGSDCRCPLCLLERVAEGRLPLTADKSPATEP